MKHSIRTEFIKKVLEEQGKNIDKSQTAAIDKYLHFRTGRLHDQRKFEVSRGSEMDGKLVATHPIRSRFLDMKPKRKDAYKKRKRSKGFPIHNRIFFGYYNRIAYSLNYGLTEEVAKKLKADLSNIEY